MPKIPPGRVEAVVADYLARVTTRDLAQREGVHVRTVVRLLRRQGVARAGRVFERYVLDETAFNALTDESAYWLGFLMADGHVTENPPTIGLHLATADRDHVVKFQKFLKTDRPVEIRAPNACRLRVNSIVLARRAMELGITPRKSLTAKAADVLVGNRHFWRGVIDGDGHLDLRGGRPRLEMVGAPPLVEQYRGFLDGLCGKRPRAYLRGKVIYTYLDGPAAASAIALLYGDSAISLSRKMTKAMAITKWQEARRRGLCACGCGASRPSGYGFFVFRGHGHRTGTLPRVVGQSGTSKCG